MTPDAPPREPLPESVVQTLEDFRRATGVDLRLLLAEGGGERVQLWPEAGTRSGRSGADDAPACATHRIMPRDGPPLDLEVSGEPQLETGALAEVLGDTLVRTYDAAREIRFFTYEVSERYEEINLLYSISETLGSILQLDEAARNILSEVSDVLGARRGSLWVYDPEREELRLTAWVGEKGLEGPLTLDDPRAITARVFREGRPRIVTAEPDPSGDGPWQVPESVLSVPIRYTPPSEEPRTVGVLNLIGRRRGGRFTASDQKLLSAIASQVGAALENNRLIRETLAQERAAREMELAHDLQMKLLPPLEAEGIEVAGRVEPAVSVGGDFYHLFPFPGDRVGIMIGDVSGHGFPAALIMALSMSAASIYASEKGEPASVLRKMDDALRDELDSTETYLSLFYGVLDPVAGVLEYSSAGHPHAFVVSADGEADRLEATDPPLGIAGPESYVNRAVPWTSDGRLLFLFTDGLSDTLAVKSSRSGEAFVVDQVVQRRSEPPEAIVEALLGLARDATPTIPADDRTAIVLRA